MTKFAVGVFMKGQFFSRRPALWELIVFCVEATDENDAVEQAWSIGKKHANKQATTGSDCLRWKPECVSGVELLDPFPPEHGAELFSSFIREQEALGLIQPLAGLPESPANQRS